MAAADAGAAVGFVATALRALLGPILATAAAIALLARLAEPLVLSSRWYMAPTAAALYALGAIVLVAWLWQGNALRPEERALAASLRTRWLGAGANPT